MSVNVFYSDEILNAYIDNELSQHEYVNISLALAKDSELRTRIEELRVVRNLVHISYKKMGRQQKPRSPYSGSTPNIRKWIPAVAASLILFLGIFSGWLLSEYSKPTTLLQMAKSIESRTDSSVSKNNIMLHLSNDDQYRWNIILQEIEKTLETAHNGNNPVQVHLVTNAKGIKFAQLNDNPFSSRIKALIKKYPNFVVQVCRQSLNRLHNNTNEHLELLPEAEVIPSALGEIIKKRQQGWLYIKI